MLAADVNQQLIFFYVLRVVIGRQGVYTSGMVGICLLTSCHVLQQISGLHQEPSLGSSGSWVLAVSATLSHRSSVSPSCSIMAVTMPVSSPAARVDRSNECWSDMKSLIWEAKSRQVA